MPVAPRHLEPPIWLAVKVGFQVWQSVFAELANNFSEFPVMPNVFSEKIPSGKLRWQWKFPQFLVGKEFVVHLAMSQFLVVYVWFLAD